MEQKDLSFLQLLTILKLKGYFTEDCWANYKHIHLIELRKGQPAIFHQKRDTMMIELPHTTAKKEVTKVSQLLSEYVETLDDNSMVEVSTKVRVGEKPPTDWGNVVPLFQSQVESQKIARTPDTALIIYFWTNWADSCHGPLNQLNQALQQNQQWVGLVEAMAICIDDNLEEMKNKIQMSGWDSVIQHFTLQETKYEHDIIRTFEVTGLPFYVVINRDGVLHYEGAASKVKPKQLLSDLMEGKQPDTSIKLEGMETLNFKDVQEIIATISDHRALEQQYPNIEYLHVKILIDAYLQKGQEKVFADVEYHAYDVDEPHFKMMGLSISEEKKKLMNFSIRSIQTIAVPPVEDAFCIQCCAPFQYPFYWCRWTDIVEEEGVYEWRCRACMERKPEDNQDYHYMQNSILLTDEVERIPIQNIGENIQPLIQDQRKPCAFICNSCFVNEQKIGKARYVCLICRSVPNYKKDLWDICQDCFYKYADDQPGYQKKMNKNAHKSFHPFVRILYQPKDYYHY